MARNKKTVKPTTKTIDEVAKERQDKIDERVVTNTKEEEQKPEEVQPKFTEDGVKIEQNVFPPAEPNAEFYGTAAAQRELRRVKEENQKED